MYVIYRIHTRYTTGDITTKFIEQEFPKGYPGHIMTAEEEQEIITVAAVTHTLKNLVRCVRASEYRVRASQTTNIEGLSLVSGKPAAEAKKFFFQPDRCSWRPTGCCLMLWLCTDPLWRPREAPLSVQPAARQAVGGAP